LTEGGEHTSYRDYIGSFSLPFGVLIVIPACLIVLSNDYFIAWGLDPIIDVLLALLGLTLIISGVALLIKCIQMFSRIGKGTLAPWAPTKHLVVSGLYRRNRNPMISGVLLALLGESILFSSISIFIWFVLALIVNHVYFIKSEEPGLLARFGDDYQIYMENVPRWIPRRTPWYPDYKKEED
jgi:protein-S-isoprenylcysteine O-methyltransferase Ste14